MSTEADTAELARLRAQEGDYIKIIAEVLKCEPRPACEQPNNQLEAPWEVVARLRAEVERLTMDNRILTTRAESGDAQFIAVQARAERAEAALAFIAENGGTTHETECGPIACNGSWCAEQARAALDFNPVAAASTRDCAIDRAERAEAEVERLKELLRIESASAQHALAAAERAEAELEEARKDSKRYRYIAWRSDTNPIMIIKLNDNILLHGYDANEAIDAAMKEGAK